MGWVARTRRTPTRGTGIGLDALRKRLAARYGTQASLHVESAVGAGFTATVRLPAEDRLPMHDAPAAGTPLRAVIVEDEPLARDHLRALVQGHDALQLVGEAADGETACALIDAARPDVVFLDVRMPGRDGFAVLESLRYRPHVVFTTAHDAHAVQAFELGAVDYLLKPFGAVRFATSVSRLRERVALPVRRGAT
jgi:CheY-like chemotaxis protein